MDGLDLLKRLPDRFADLWTLDPQYRSVLDALEFGNEGERQIGRAALPQMTDATIRAFIREIERVSKASTHGLLWMDKFCLASGSYRAWLDGTAFKVVDLIAWNKMRPGMGRRARCVTEYLVIVQKPPVRAKDHWSDHSLRDSWAEYSDRDVHPHCKPYALTERLIRATTEAGDIVIDPCAGGYGTLEACLATGRNFVGCDLL